MKPEAVTTAVSLSANLDIPLIDFSGFQSSDPSTKRSTAQAVLHGFQTAGFIYLRNYGIPQAIVESTFAESAKFFQRTKEEKDALAWTTPEANRGYSQPGREKVTDFTTAAEIESVRAQEGADLKESIEIGKENEPGFPNHWPANSDDFKQQMNEFFDLCKDLHINIMRSIAVGLGIDEYWFDAYCDGGDNTLRLLHYPEVQAEVFKKNNGSQVRAGAHTDYGSITLLFQDMAGGLQVRSPNGSFIDATPIEGTIVVNAGDLLARWSNDTIKSTVHRVVQPPTTAEIHPARYTIPYFCHPNHDSLIDAIPGTFGEDKPKKYQAVNCGEHLIQRLKMTY